MTSPKGESIEEPALPIASQTTTEGVNEDTGDRSSQELSEQINSYSKEAFENLLREILRSDNIASMTKRKSREELERRLDLPQDALVARKADLTEIIDRIVTEITQANDTEETAEQDIADPAVADNASDAEEKGRVAKSEQDDSESEGADDESDESSDSGRRKRKTTKRAAQPKKRLKALQSRLMTRAAFLDTAAPMDVAMGPLTYQMAPRCFSTKSVGWFYGSKVQIPVGETMVHCQLTVNCAVLGSKDWKDGKRASEK
eukprot:Selendium_serpulae@DN6156_c1_g1_i6.p1